MRVAAKRAGAGYVHIKFGTGALETLGTWLHATAVRLRDCESDDNLVAAFSQDCKLAIAGIMSNVASSITVQASTGKARVSSPESFDVH